MLTAKDVYDLAEANNMRITNRWSTDFTSGREVPQLVEINLFFMEQKPDVWRTLMTTPCDVVVNLSGTRQVTGSGATDGTFYPCYAELLPEVNAIRANLGWEKLRN